MSREEAIKLAIRACEETWNEKTCKQIREALSQEEPSRDIKEISEIMKCDADAETKCKMISNILTDKPHYFEEQERMREFTEKEAKAYSKALDKMYKPTGFNVFDEPCEVLEYDKDHIWYKGNQYISLRRFLEVKAEKEPCDDAVSRQAVDTLVDELARAISDERCHIPQRGRDTGHIMHDILDLPPIKPQEPKTGHWEWVQYDYDPKLGDWHCSECRSVVIECVNKEDKGGIPLYKYCPQCGAKIIEPQESEKV